MLHRNRSRCVGPAESAEELVRKLTEITWCCCTGFELGDYWFLNDSIGPGGAQEFAVVKKDGGTGNSVQIESITFGWCSEAQAPEHIRATLESRCDQSDFAYEVVPAIETPEQHGRCHHCT